MDPSNVAFSVTNGDSNLIVILAGIALIFAIWHLIERWRS
jgi:hypothetical protein